MLKNQESQEASGSKAISRHQQRLLENLEIREVKIWKPICRAALKSGDSAGGGSEKVGVEEETGELGCSNLNQIGEIPI